MQQAENTAQSHKRERKESERQVTQAPRLQGCRPAEGAKRQRGGQLIGMRQSVLHSAKPRANREAREADELNHLQRHSGGKHWAPRAVSQWDSAKASGPCSGPVTSERQAQQPSHLARVQSDWPLIRTQPEMSKLASCWQDSAAGACGWEVW